MSVFDNNTGLIVYSLSPNSIISEIVDRAITDEHLESSDDDVRHVFLSILLKEDLDIREKKSAIVDFIAAGIETVIWSKPNFSYFYYFLLLINISASQYTIISIVLHIDATRNARAYTDGVPKR